ERGGCDARAGFVLRDELRVAAALERRAVDLTRRAWAVREATGESARGPSHADERRRLRRRLRAERDVESLRLPAVVRDEAKLRRGREELGGTAEWLFRGAIREPARGGAPVDRGTGVFDFRFLR